MRLVIATPLYPPEPGGPATYAKLLEEGLPSRGITVDVVKFSDVRHLPKGIRHVVYYRNVLRAARNADAVLALDPVSVGLPALQAAKKAKKPFFVKIVGDYAWEQGTQRFGVAAPLDVFVMTRNVPLPVNVLRMLQTHVARQATKLIVPSEYLRTIVTAWGVPEERVRVIYNAVELPAFGSLPEVVAQMPSPRIVSVGRLVPWKGMRELIDAVATLRGRGTAASLIIVGDGPELERLRDRAFQTLRTNYLLIGALPHETTLAVMQKADIFVLNSSYEGLSHTLIEAKLLGLPIVTTAAGGNSEVTEGGLDAVWVDPQRSNELADALEDLLLHDEKGKQLATEGKHRAESRFSLPILLDALASEITSAL